MAPTFLWGIIALEVLALLLVLVYLSYRDNEDYQAERRLRKRIRTGEIYPHHPDFGKDREV